MRRLAAAFRNSFQPVDSGNRFFLHSAGVLFYFEGKNLFPAIAVDFINDQTHF